LHETPTSGPCWSGSIRLENNRPASNTFLFVFLATALALLTGTDSAIALEIKTDYTTIVYPSNATLHEFNDNLYLGRNLEFRLRAKKTVTIEEEVAFKVDILIEKAQEVMGMHIVNFNFRIILHSSADKMQQEYLATNKRKVHYKAYYSLKHNILNIGVDEVNLRVFSHELGHVIVDHYFKVRPPGKIHEVLAQYCEINITN